MPFVLRSDSSDSNPALASVYGLQITQGQLVYYINENRTKAIIILGEGEMDGLNRIYYAGELIPEYADAGQTDRNWRFHPGTLTTQINPKDVTAVATDTLTLASGHGFVVGDEVAIVAGVDPETSPYPEGVTQHKKLYVVSVASNDIQMSLTSGGTPLSGWTDTAGYLTTNLKVYKADAGYFDPVQGRPQFFPEVDFTFSGICYVEVQLPSGIAEGEEPDQFKIFVRGKRLQNYDATGQLADDHGVAYNPLALPAQTKFFSANNALVAIDIMLNSMKIEKSRIDWATFVAYRDRCDEIITWDSGPTEVAGNPTFTLTNASSPALGNVTKTAGVSGQWDAGALTVESTTKIKDLYVSAVYRGGHSALGLTRATTVPTIFYGPDMLYSIHPSIYDNHVRIYEGNSDTPIYNQLFDFQYGDIFKIEVHENDVVFYKNDAPFYTATASFGPGTTRGFVALESAGASWSDVKFYPMTGAARAINRFDAHIVFPSQTDSYSALQSVLGRSPDTHWQDVNGKIRFVTGAAYDTSGTPSPGERVLAGELVYDPTQSLVPSNIVSDSFSAYRTPPEEKANFLRIELRDLDDIYFTKKYSYTDRDALRDQAGNLVDFGVVPMGVTTQSLADRVGEAVMRWSSDLDLFVTLKGSPSTYPFAKGDVLKLAHDVPGWDLANQVEFIVIEESFEEGGQDERAFLLQAYNPDFYSDTDHGPITANFPVSVSKLTPPPAPLAMDLAEETRTLPDGTTYTAIVGTVYFDTAYPYTQRARVYWKRTTDVEYLPTTIVLQQPNSTVSAMNFELNFASIGINSVKVVTETVTGITSGASITSNIDISGSIQVDYVEWEGHVNTETLLTNLTKTAGANAWDAGARSAKELHHGSGYVQWTVNSTGRTALGFNTYNNTTLASNDSSMLYGLITEVGQQPIPIVSGTNQTAVGSTTQVGYAYKIEIDAVNNLVKFYEVVNDVPALISSTTRLDIYPLYVDASLYSTGSYISQPQFYGRLEQTTGYRFHWTNIAGINITGETYTKFVGSGWFNPNQANAYSIEYLNGDGALEFETTEYDKYRIVGLSPVDVDFLDPTKPGFKSVKYGWYMKGSEFGDAVNRITVVEGDGTNYTEYGGWTHTTGDILRIERIGTTIYYRQNGVLRYTSTIASPTGEQLHGDLAFYTANSTAKNVRLKKAGFFTPGIYPYPIYRASSLKIMESRPEADGTVYIQLSGVFPPEEGATILRANVKVYDKFGNIVKVFPPFTYAGNGVIGQGFHNRKYADPMSEAIYEISVANDDTTSSSVFIQGDGSGNFTPYLALSSITLKRLDQAVKDLTASPLDHTQINLVWNYSGQVQIQYRVGTTGAWSTAITGLTSPYTVTGLVPDTFYEFRAAPTGTTDNYSNISRAKTAAAPASPDTYPPPLNLVGTLDATNPESKVVLSWTRNSSTNAGVRIYQNGTEIAGSPFAAGTTSYTVTGLSANTTYTFKVRNNYTSPATADSVFSNEVSITTGTVEAVNRPSSLTATGVGSYRIDLRWVNHVSTGSIEIHRSIDGDSWTLYDSVSATLDKYSDVGVSPGDVWYYKVKNTGIAGFSNVALGTTYEVLDSGGGCIALNTIVHCWFNGQVLLKRAWQVNKGDELLTMTRGGIITTTKVKQVIIGKTTRMNILTTDSGKSLQYTLSHPILTSLEMTFEKGSSIKAGDNVLVYDDVLACVYPEMVQSIDILEGDFNIVIYELEGEEHTFISNNIISHNVAQKY